MRDSNVTHPKWLRIAALGALLGVLTIPCAATAQKSPRQEKNFIGNLINQDYFTADVYPEVQSMLTMVTKFHSGERVWQNFHNGDYQSVIGDCEFLIRYFTNHPGALHLFAEVGKATNRPGYAIPYFEMALREYPQHAYTHAQYGHYLVEIGAISAGLLELREAVRMDPDLLIAQGWLAEAEDQSQAQSTSPRVRPGP
jgi:predicted Zn-dependent protease